MMRLIINADDFGIDHERDRGILAMARRGIVTSVTALATGEAFARDIDRLRAMSHVSIGLHLNLTEGPPLRTCFRPPFFRGKDAFWSGTSIRAWKEILDEFRAQTERFIAVVGRRPSHVDGHQHIHVAPNVTPAVVRLCREYGIGKVRMVGEPAFPLRGEPERLRMVRRWTNAARGASAIFRRAGLRSPDLFLGMEFLFNPTVKMLIDILRALPENGAAELMVHPGYRRKGAGSPFSSAAREREMAALTGRRVGSFLKRSRLISYDEL